MKDTRLTAIRQHLYRQGFATVQDIADAVGASSATIRRDLQTLEDKGVVSRTHGGARLAAGTGTEVAFGIREGENLTAKRAIADAAFDLIRPQSSLFLDASTTVLQLARRLKLDPMPLAVFTNGLSVAQELMEVPKLTVTLIGGRLRSSNASTVGVSAEGAIERLWFDQLFLGASAIAADCILSTPDEDEGRLNARMKARSTQTVLLADSSKFGLRHTYEVIALDPSIRIITDERLPPPFRERLGKAGCRVTLVSIDEPGEAGLARVLASSA